MKVIKYIILSLALALPAVSSAQTTQKLSATKINEYGLIYSLPATMFDITLEAEGYIEKPGEFCQYARYYLNADPILRESSGWKLKSASVSSRGVADTDQQYLVQFKAGSSPFILVNEESVPLAINSADIITVEEPLLPIAKDALPTVLDSPEAAYAVTPEMSAATSLAKRAKLAAERIAEIRATRNEIISGQSDNMPSDGAAMKLVLDNLASQEAVLTAMFLGTRQECTQVRSYTLLPGVEDERVVVARLSDTEGFVDASDKNATPIYINVKVLERGQLPVNEKGEEKRFPKGGVAYRIPGKGQISITYDSKTFADAAWPIAQYGVVFGIDPALFTDKKAPAYMIFDPVTGAVREIGTTKPAPVEKSEN